MRVNHGRTLITCTRYANGVYDTFVCNDLDSITPYIVLLRTPPDSPPRHLLEPGEELPACGETLHYLHRWLTSEPVEE